MIIYTERADNLIDKKILYISSCCEVIRGEERDRVFSTSHCTNCGQLDSDCDLRETTIRSETRGDFLCDCLRLSDQTTKLEDNLENKVLL